MSDETEEEEAQQSGRRAQITWASEITMRPVVWAWTDTGEGRIPAGSLSVAAGREGTGKSSFGIWLAAQITRGTLPGTLEGTPRRVLYVAIEGSWEHTLAPQLLATGADLGMVVRFEVVQDEDDQVLLRLPYDNALLEGAIREHDVALVVVDPLMSVISDSIDTHRTRDVRTALEPLARLADRTRCVLLAIAHVNEGAGNDPSSLTTGSGAFKDVPRSIFGFVRDSEADDGSRVMTQTKCNLGRDDLPSLRYTVEDASIPTDYGPAHVGRLVWHGTSDRTAQDILGDSGSSPKDRADREDAASLLRDYLAGLGSEAPTLDVQKAGRLAGFSADALKRAKGRAGVRSSKNGLSGGWAWALDGPAPKPEGSTEGSQGSTDRTDALFALPSGHSAHHQGRSDCLDCATSLVAAAFPGAAVLATGEGDTA